MSNSRKRAFSLIELLAALSVVMALAVVAFAYGNSYKDNANNSKRLADIDALQNVADTYFRAKSTYPTPKANAIPYDKDGRYAHDNPYGYSSFVTDELFGTEFLREVPRDPANNAYYAYGKQNPGKESPTGSYDFATVDLHEGTYYAYVRGNYDASRLVSLIRAYNSPEFVQNGTDKYLPYDPNAMKLTGRITSSSGAIYVIRSGEKHGPTAFSGELMEGDRIQSSPGSFATMYFADGSEIRLGNATQTGTIDIDALTYKDHSIATRLRLFLRE